MIAIAIVNVPVGPKNGTFEAVDMTAQQREVLEADTTAIADVIEITAHAQAGTAKRIDHDRVVHQSPTDVETSVESRDEPTGAGTHIT